jgi:hypothetical protein
VKGEDNLRFLSMKHKQFQARVMKKMMERQEDGGDAGQQVPIQPEA